MELIEKMKAAIVKVDHSGQATPREVAQAALTALIEHAGGDGVTDGDRQIAEASLTVFGPSLVELIARHRATAFAAGRAARNGEIVEWLRGRDCFGPWQPGHFADAIERGEV